MRLFPIILICSLLASCAGFEMAEWHENGQPKKYVAVDHFMSKSDGSATERKMAAGGITTRSAHTKPDSTEVPKQVISAAVQAAVLKGYFRNEQEKSKQEGASKLKATDDPDVIPVDPHKPVPAGNPHHVPVPVETAPAPAPSS